MITTMRINKVIGYTIRSFLVLNMRLVICQSRYKISGGADSLQITSHTKGKINNILRSTRKRLTSIIYDLLWRWNEKTHALGMIKFLQQSHLLAVHSMQPSPVSSLVLKLVQDKRSSNLKELLAP
jgi:predicted phosphatase